MGEDATDTRSLVIRPNFDPIAREFASITDDEWETAWESPMRAVIAQMQAAFHDDVRRIVVVIPTTAMSGGAGYAHVAAPAEALRVLVKSAARQWGTHGITVNAVALAPEDVLSEISRSNPTTLGLPALTTRDPTALIDFLCSEAAGDITGQTIVVDGGVWM